MDEDYDEKLQIAFHCVLSFGSLASLPRLTLHIRKVQYMEPLEYQSSKF